LGFQDWVFMNNACLVVASGGQNTSELAGHPARLLAERRGIPLVPFSALAEYKARLGRKILMLMGYADAGYQDLPAVLTQVSEVLAALDSDDWIICSGATACGIGAAYHTARQAGFHTLGIVSSLALSNNETLSDYVDDVFFIEDQVWGGRNQDGLLSPTSKAIVALCDEVLAFGGNVITRDELLAAHEIGKPVRYIPADRNHQRAQQAADGHTPECLVLRGLAHEVLRGFK